MVDVASTNHSTLYPVSFKLSSTLTEEQRGELAVEADFYGLLDRVMPYYAQEQIGVALLMRACKVDAPSATKRVLETAAGAYIRSHFRLT